MSNEENLDRTSSGSKHASRKEQYNYLYKSAIEAEMQTGRKETSDKANRPLFLRIVTIFIGLVITVLGAMMLVLPGPGLIVMAIGLGILAIDVPFARRLLNIVRKRLPQDEKGTLTKKTIFFMVAFGVIGVTLSSLSIWWRFFR